SLTLATRRTTGGRRFSAGFILGGDDRFTPGFAFPLRVERSGIRGPQLVASRRFNCRNPERQEDRFRSAKPPCDPGPPNRFYCPQTRHCSLPAVAKLTKRRYFWLRWIERFGWPKNFPTGQKPPLSTTVHSSMSPPISCRS